MGSPQYGHALDARNVAALSRRLTRPNMGTQYLWGRDLLIAPVFKKGAATRDVYLPQGDWYDWWTNGKKSGGKNITKQVDLSIMPIYVRAGAIIPFDPVRQYTGEAIAAPTTLKIYSGADGDFTLYEDDGISQDYLKGKGTWTHITWNDRSRTLTIVPGAPKGSTNQIKKRMFKIELIPGSVIKDVHYDGKAARVVFQPISVPHL